MSSKLMLIAVPTMACLFTLCVVDGASSNAFAKGGPMGHGPVVKNGRGFGRDFRNDFRRDFRHFDRYGWNYGYGYTYPVYETVAPVCETVETVAPVCETCEPVVAPVVAPVCEPVYFGSNYGSYGWGYNHFRKDHNPPHRFHPLNNKGGRKG